MKQSQFQYFEGRKKRKEMYKAMNDEMKKEIEKNGFNEKFTVLRGKFDGHEYQFDGKKLSKKTLVIPEIKLSECQIQILYLSINQYCLTQQGFIVQEFVGKILKTGKEVYSLQVGDFVLGRDFSQNCFKDIIVTNQTNLMKLNDKSESNFINYLGNMSSAVLPFELIKNIIIPHHLSNILIIGSGVIAMKLSDLLQKKKIHYCLAIEDTLYSKYQSFGYNVIKVTEIDLLLLHKIDAIIDFKNDFKHYKNLDHQLIYIHLTVLPKQKSSSLLSPNKTHLLPNVYGHASFIEFNCSIDNNTFFNDQKEVSSMVRPHISSVININDNTSVEDSLIRQQEEDETLIVSL
ncbi:hypothetical protein KM1_136650 [Entamoeba histolytica HM-3:IMSS]|uniref:Uncharacterized protein n=5 Tax=Entamoeba histolytica TaxID=5759 RepID=B1N4P0_ENTH1|nr:hypothetical protein EHI_018620 [Entamoeba histolytica HM-1:IMSS]EMD42389.1 Hypothetical protein EHI5A_113110 [Entamoeba histolytica KU27]EMS16292.1 hypothetical protein KM1_136650 [Entamoeba histolytica HM-3:IMSS]ENY64176.1 hypothetical protein EHI7A_070820 [Entamoeba histolytica HM-1:IMSS-A]GAT98657.1 hypothetical protein CL6EHI_018620 [Entamoeba histolytica]EDS89069.1 hypothetical protein EHI_018620 [Entamoeba histolytica HM-1:IMSS]|eukprot:XP_001914156.1 hypothetical protein EHI_018620 [Entamoeba histolytica HM-1:IMSS]